MSKKSLFEWIVQDTLYFQIRRYAMIVLLTLHPWLGIIFHNPNDFFKNTHRLAILVTALLSYLAANACFFGQKAAVPISDFLIAV